jgi:hypothetical protein
LNSGFNQVRKDRMAESQDFRAEVAGLEQREMAQILHVSPATITFDLQYLRDEARENVRDYTTKQFPLQFKVSLVAIQNAMRQFWNISQNAQDNKEKMQALEHYRQCHIDMMAMLKDGGYVLERHIAEEITPLSPYIGLHQR